MKFVCDNCQAKYQIGDDKVAGKTVRMKCRKCGYNIKVSATDVVSSPPAAGDSASHVEHSLSVPTGVSLGETPNPSLRAGSLGETPKPPPGPAAQSPVWSEDDESTQMMSMPAAAAGMIAPRGTVPAVGGPSAAPRPAPRPVPAPPRPVGAAAPGTRSTTSPGRAVPPAPTRHPSGTMPRPAGLGEPGKPPRPVARTTTMSGSHVAVRAEPEHEWYVGVGGTPIGPVRLSVIRERAVAREVDGESLVWREGMSEWKALRNYPELLEVVNEARAAPAPAPAPLLVTPTPIAALSALSAPAAPASSPGPQPAASAPVAAVAAAPIAPAPIAPAPIAPAPIPAPPAPAIVVAPEVVPAAKQNGKSNGFHVEGSLAAKPAEPAVVGPVVPPDAPPAVAAAAAAPAAVKAPAPADDLASLEESLIPRRRGGVHPMAYAFVAAAAVFGGVAAWVLLRPQQPQIVFVQAPPQTVTTTPTAVADKGSEPAVEVGEISAAPGSTARPGTGGGPRPKATATAVAAAGTGAPIDTSGFVNNVPGPTATAPAPGNAGGTLSAGEISAVVAQNQAIIKRKCWVPALEARAPSSPSNARVNGSLVIGASGAVESASASGGDSFPGLASCIQSRMKNWHFPPSGSSSTVQVPFVFAGQ